MIEPVWLEHVVVVLTGLLFGSFSTLASYRLVHEEPGIVAGRSRCPSCHHTLGVLDLFPVLSWVVLKAKCRYCGVRVSGKYPLIELAQAAMFYVVYLRYGVSAEALLFAALSVALVVMIVVDFECLIIPDGLNIAIAIIGTIYAFLYRDIGIALAGAAIGVVSGFALRWIFTCWKKVEALGLGDVKFMAAAGVFLGIDLFIAFFFLAGVIGVVTAVLWGFAGRGRQFPFGPALALSLFVCALFPGLQGMLREQVTEILVEYMMPVNEVYE
jgi:leader peptidase (prepilin peptidase)/N-methyltransferase